MLAKMTMLAPQNFRGVKMLSQVSVASGVPVVVMFPGIMSLLEVELSDFGYSGGILSGGDTSIDKVFWTFFPKLGLI